MPRPSTAHLNRGSDDEFDGEDTPKPKSRASRIKRRVSQYKPSDNNNDDDTETVESFRIPLKPVNDELAEKRSLKRRKSKMGLPFETPIDGEENENIDASGGHVRTPGDPQKTPKKSALARANQLKSVTAPQPVTFAPIEINNNAYEEWMKLATDNKINATNSWDFALIDYFHDMSLLRNDTDNSINFQKASRTLDGCVKIWTSRVDSVGTDTGKLLSNLAEEGRKLAADDDENNEDGDNAESSKKKKASRTEATLAKDAKSLQTKKLDLEFAVDPLFKKTSADFDEGGAQGLLMNHLAVDGNLRVVFDAGDTPGGADEDEQEEAVTIPVPLADLRAKLDLESLPFKSIMSSRLGNFKFSSDAASADISSFNRGRQHDNEDLDSADEADFQDPIPTIHDMEDSGFDGGFDDMDAGAAPATGGGGEDFFTGDQAVDVDNYPQFDGGIDYDNEGGEEYDNPDGVHVAAAHAGHGVPGGPLLPFDPRKGPNQKDLTMAMTEEGGQSMFDYFDSSVIKNWAGPEHWKLKKVIRKVAPTEPAAPKQRKEKVAFSIDFSKALTAEEEKKLFEPPSKGSSLTLPAKQCAYIGGKKGKRGAEREKREEKLLPDDMHFSSRQLLSLFLKPKFTLKMRGHRTSLQVDNSDEVDEHFWAKAAAEQARAADPDDPMNTQGGGAIPFNTQFFHDEDDFGGGFDGGFDDDIGGEGVSTAVSNLPAPGDEEDLLAATQGKVRRVKPEFVNYAKKVKRVDVRKLKENIWKELDIVVPIKEEEDEEDEEKPERPLTDPDDAKQFTSVIDGLRKTYPKEKMEEISTSFCFICLLHLANERGLKIEGDAGKLRDIPMEDGKMEDDSEPRKVGDIWGLKIYRDPDAEPSA